MQMKMDRVFKWQKKRLFSLSTLHGADFFKDKQEPPTLLAWVSHIGYKSRWKAKIN